MTPQEKAEDLIAKIHQFIPLADNSYPKERVEYKNFNAKQCALIAVDEILNDYEDRLVSGAIDFITAKDQPLVYWREVREAIEKL